MHGGRVKSGCQLERLLVFVLSDYPLVVALLAARVNRPGIDANLEQSVFTAMAAGGVAGAVLRERKLHPEAAKQFDGAETNAVKHQQRNNGENTGKVLGDKFDDGDKQEAAHQAAEQPGKTQVELSFVPAVELLLLHDPVLHASILGR